MGSLTLPGDNRGHERDSANRLRSTKAFDLVRDITGSTSDIVTVPYDEAYEQGFENMHRRIPDTGKIARLPRWSPTFNLDAILQDVVESQRSDEVVETSSTHGA